MYEVEPVHDDVAGRDLQATMQERRRIKFGQKTDRAAPGLDRESVDLWKGYVETLHPKPLHADLGNLGMKISFRCGKQRQVGKRNRRLEGRRISKTDNSDQRHFCS